YPELPIVERLCSHHFALHTAALVAGYCSPRLSIDCTGRSTVPGPDRSRFSNIDLPSILAFGEDALQKNAIQEPNFELVRAALSIEKLTLCSTVLQSEISFLEFLVIYVSKTNPSLYTLVPSWCTKDLLFAY